MAITYGFFNSLNGDRVYNADQIGNMFKGLISDGVYDSVDHAYIVKPSSGLTLSVGSGRAIVYDKWAENDADINITLNAAHVTLNRYTAIVLRKSVTNRAITLEMIDGTPATTPTKPDILRNESNYDLCLAYVYVPAGANNITAANIEDTRANTSICGFVHGLVEQVDTTELFNQYKAACEEDIARMTAWEEQQKAAFNAWFETLSSQLLVNTYIERLQANYTVTDERWYIQIPEELEYTTSDILDVYINGVLYVEDLDYTIELNEVEGGYMTKFVESLQANEATTQIITFIVTRSKIGFSTT